MESSTAITVQPGPVEPCHQQNGAITDYSVRYGEVGTSVEERRVEMASGASMIRVSGLTKETVYTVEVAAETSGGTGVYSEPLTIETPDSECVFCLKQRSHVVFTSLTDVFLSLNGKVIPNHGYVKISDIGFSNSTALVCHTNRPPPPGSAHSGGNWFAPDGTKVGAVGSTGVSGFVKSRGLVVVRLRRWTSGPAPDEGIYKCSIRDGISTYKSLYIGLYNGGGGKKTGTITTGVVSMSGGMTFTLLPNNHFILTCISTGGPATTVTWTRHLAPAVGLIDTVVVDRETAKSSNTLLVTGRMEGLYTCTVSNRVSNESSASLNVAGEDHTLSLSYYLISLLLLSPVPSPPSGVMVSQNGLNSLLVTWAPSAGPNVTGYTIFYLDQNGQESGLVEVRETETNVTITGLMRGSTYNISIMANSSTLPGDIIAGPAAHLTIGIGIYGYYYS